MKVFVAAALAALILALGSAWVLDTRFQETARQRFTSDGVRLDPSS